MFTNLIGYIKPFLRKDTTAMTDITKTRPVEDEHQQQDNEKKDFEGMVHDDTEKTEDAPPKTAHRPVKMELSIAAIRRLIDESDTEHDLKAEALDIVDRLEAAGYETLPLKTDKSVIDQIQHYKIKGDTHD